jgi:hypothetical protein
MQHRNTRTPASIVGRIDAAVHDIDALRAATSEPWQSLSDSEKLALTRQVDPVDEDTVRNVTTDGLHEYFVDNLDPDQTGDATNLTASHLGLGTDGGSGTATTDTDLNNRVFSTSVTDHADNDNELLASTFLDSTQANGHDLDELGLYTGDPANLTDNDVLLLNHASFTQVTKDNSKTVTFDVTLQFSDI